ncbi:hypothetical protein ACFFU1_17445 [Algibacter miyuki]|uniref:DUF4394 domain-containing protein n=1 Tax=Algibacter miyuki TaxID=1306933 RepID=A0ABV5H455_9FLAO|nr:hypothetical protein [Algibacter miyuki]MDN3664542.1 hypothetical protein [Algibacter miyuki]
MKKNIFILGLFLVIFKTTVIAQTTGINTNTPTESLDVGEGNVRVRDINTNIGIGGQDRMVVADADGVLRTLDHGAYTLFHARLAANQSLVKSTISTMIFSAPLTTSPIYSYDTTTGVLTFNQVGNYLITLQGSFVNVTDQTQLLLGIRPVPDGPYLGRGSRYAAIDTGSTIGELLSYTTMIVVPSVGYQIRFIAAPNRNGGLLATESGSTGSGNVSNVTVQKI